MKRDIFFSEITPLSFKDQQRTSPPIVAIMSIFEILIVAVSTVLLPSIQNSCDESPLYIWVSVMVITLNLHLVLSGVENLCEKFGFSKGFGFSHGVFFAVIGVVLGYGHYAVFFQGLGCYHTQIFWVSSVLAGVLDLLLLTMLGMGLNYYFSLGKLEH